MNETKLNTKLILLEQIPSSDKKEEGALIGENYKKFDFDEPLVENGETMVRTAESEDLKNDGADEKMLELQPPHKEVEVKFIQGDQVNGDAKIDIEMFDKVFTGMTKEELMKYANDPFWVRLRWILFIAFWLLWVAMLLGAIWIIVQAPKCAAPVPHQWFKQGPLVMMDSDGEPKDEEVKLVQAYGAKGVIYKLPGDETYLVGTPSVDQKIKNLVRPYEEAGIKVVLDVTPNYVMSNDQLFQKALTDADEREAFVWSERSGEPTNWLALENGSAWKEVQKNNWVLSQFGANRYDLRMDTEVAQDKFKAVLSKLVELGVHGFRLANTKHFIIDPELRDEQPAEDKQGLVHTDYHFWTHSSTTFRDGIGDVMDNFRRHVHNLTLGDGFLSVSEDIVRPEVYKTSITKTFGVDLPQYGRAGYLLGDSNAVQLWSDLRNANSDVMKYTWAQFVYNSSHFHHIPASEYNIFMMLLPGVPIVTLDALEWGNSSVETVKELERIRSSPSLMHGSFDVSNDANRTTIGYTRYKSGNPGYFVALNPTDFPKTSNFSHITGMSRELKVHLLSDNFQAFQKSLNATVKIKDNVPSDAIDLPPKSAAVFTYVATGK